MSNNLNIDTENLKNDSSKLFLYDPVMYVDLEPPSTPKVLGYMEKEKTITFEQEYAVFETGIPASEIRRDIIRQSFKIEGMLKQFQKETLALVMQRSVDNTDSEWDRVIIGTEVPAAIFPSVILMGQNVDGDELRLYIRRLQITAETLEIALGAEEYSSIPFVGTAQKDETPLVTQPDWPYNPAKANEDNIAFWALNRVSST